MKYEMNEFLHYSAFAAQFDVEHSMSGLTDRVLEKSEVPMGKQICTTLTKALTDELEQVLSLLGMTKRRFIEMAVINALDEAKLILEVHGVEDYLGSKADELSKGGTDNE